jgi:hypothetical protein
LVIRRAASAFPGLFQQRASWGSVADRLNPAKATNAFLDKMLREYPNDGGKTAVVDDVCRRVQVSAYPDRCRPQAATAPSTPGTASD